MKKKVVVANLKMNLNIGFEQIHWFGNFAKAKKGVALKNTKLVLCPPALLFGEFSKKIKAPWVELGTQDCSPKDKGPFTGEISPLLLKSLGGEYVILGHSERRVLVGETDELVSQKITMALKAGITPVVCVGENAEEKARDLLLEVVSRQLRQCLAGVTPGRIEKVVLCYEPVWAISANSPDRIPTTNEIMGARLLIKRFVSQKYGVKVAEKILIIYGGSVQHRNVFETCISSGMDGALVGGASLSPYDLVSIAKQLDGQAG